MNLDTFLEYAGAKPKPCWRPLRPAVSVPDIVVSIVVLSLALSTSGFTALYFFCAVMLYAVSGAYHWLDAREAGFLHKLDRSMIHVMIMATPLPYLPHIIEAGNLSWFVAMCSWGVFWIIAKLCFGRMMYKGPMPTLVYFVTYALGMATLVVMSGEFPDLWWWLVWGGILFYAVQSVIYSLGWPNEYASRVLQHVVLHWLALAPHAYAALLYGSMSFVL